LVLEYSRDEVLRRLANPFWFQALGCVMGMDWHSSASRPACWVRSNGSGPVQWSWVCMSAGDAVAIRATPRRNCSRWASACRSTRPPWCEPAAWSRKWTAQRCRTGLLCTYTGSVTDDGKWTVVQQGMNPDRRQARRYTGCGNGRGHLSTRPTLRSRHSARKHRELHDRQAAAARAATVALANGSPEAVVVEVERAERLVLPDHHDVREKDVDLRRLLAALTVAANAGRRIP